MESLMALPSKSLLQTRRPRAVAPARLQSDLDRQRDDRLGREPGMLARGLGCHTVPLQLAKSVQV